MAKLVSKVYSQALFDTAKESGKLELIYEEVSLLKEIFEQNRELQKILDSPKIVREEKISAVQAIFAGKVCEEVLGLMALVIEKGRQSSLLRIFEDFIADVKEFKGIGLAYVTSAVELSEEQKKNIESRLLETSGYQAMEMHFTTDASLIKRQQAIV